MVGVVFLQNYRFPNLHDCCCRYPYSRARTVRGYHHGVLLLDAPGLSLGHLLCQIKLQLLCLQTAAKSVCSSFSHRGGPDNNENSIFLHQMTTCCEVIRNQEQSGGTVGAKYVAKWKRTVGSHPL